MYYAGVAVDSGQWIVKVAIGVLGTPLIYLVVWSFDGELRNSLKNAGWVVSQMNKEYENKDQSGQRPQYQTRGPVA